MKPIPVGAKGSFSPPEQLAEAEAMVTKVIGRCIAFMVQVKEGAREIGVGTHERVVVDKAKADGEPA
jgi:predicted thioesterase